MRFFAVTGATVLAMGMAGKVVREGGLKLVYNAEKYAGKGAKYSAKMEETISSYKRIQNVFDEMQGVLRDSIDKSTDSLVIRDETGKYARNSRITVVDDLNQRMSKENLLDKSDYRKEIQRRLIGQARRLPYELPGLYIAQKAVIDPVMGTNKERPKVNWANPFDVVGDFAYQSIKNLAGSILPFETAAASGKVGFRSLMKTMQDPNASVGVQTVRELLSRVGASSADIFNKTARFSQSSMGAFSSLVQDAKDNAVTFPQLVKRLSTNNVTAKAGSSNAGYARNLFTGAKAKENIFSVLDALPGPFKGLASAISESSGSGNGFLKNFRNNKEAFNQYQEIISGRRTLSSYRNDENYQNLLTFMQRGGQTRVEQIATQTYKLGRFNLGKGNADEIGESFFSTRFEHKYREELIRQLDSVGVPLEKAEQMVKTLNSRVSPIPGGKSPYPGGENLMERFRFLSESYHGEKLTMKSSQNEWWDHVIKTFNKHQILDKSTGDKLTFDVFKQAVQKADTVVNGSHFQDAFKLSVNKEWGLLKGTLIPDMIDGSVKSMARPYEQFTGSLLNNQREFLIKRTAQRLGISTVTDTGLPLPMNNIRNQIAAKGFDPNNLERMRGFLISQKDIANPYSIKNLFGIQSVSLNEAFANNYFSSSSLGVQKEIKSIIDARTNAQVIGRGGNTNLRYLKETRNDFRMSGLYRTSNGEMIDLGRIGRSFTRGFEKFVDNYQVPILKFNPFNMLGSSSFKTWRNTNPIMFAAGESKQLFEMAAGKEFKRPDFYVWMKNTASSTKGRVVGIDSLGAGGNPAYRVLGDNYRPFIDVKDSMMSKFARLWSGNGGTPRSAMQGKILQDGQLIDDPQAGKWDKWRRRFDVATDQPNKFIGGKDSAVSRWWSALKGKPEASADPHIFARNIAKPGFNINGRITEFESQGFSKLRNMLRDAGFSPQQIRESAVLKELETQGMKIHEIPDVMLPTIAERMLKEDLAKAGSDQVRQQLRESQGPIRGLLNQANKYGGLGSNFFDLETSNAVSSTVSRRIDQLRASIIDYALLKEIQTGNVDLGSLLKEVDQMASGGIISKAQKSEARAAVLSLKIDEVFQSQGNKKLSLLGRNQQAIKQIMGDQQYADIVGEIGNYSIGNEGRFSTFKPQLRRFLKSSPYSPQFEINPLGRDPFFVPTFSEAFRKNGLKTLQGVLGISSKPQAISGMAMPMTHMVTRLDRYFQTFGLGLDPLSYNSPLDLYARGMIGKRVLPIVAGGSTLLAVDRTLGGIVNPRDEQGNKVYSPLILGTAASGIANAQALTAGVIPGGQTYQEKKDELESGEVPIRQGRFWLLGNTPFKGGRIQYFRPSWYQRLKSGASYTPEMNETPMERLLFGYDFSPLRPFDPYRREREDYYSRPYPVSGDYFTGPWGPLTGALNATLGKVLKPSRLMHKEEMRYGLQQYLPVGEAGAYMSGTPVTGAPPSYSGTIATQSLSGINNAYMQAAYSPGGTPSSAPFYGSLGFAPPRGRASFESRQRVSAIASEYSNIGKYDRSATLSYQMKQADQTFGYSPRGGVPFGVPSAPGRMQARVVSAEDARQYGTTGMNLRRFGYQSQELFGIYGFASSSMRDALGMGSRDFAPNAAVLEPASRGYSSSRSFWNLNLGGMGDLPLPVEGKFSNFELSEIVRRFVPKEPSGMNYVNPLPNLMGQQYPWLPGSNYPLAPIKMGDPYNAIPEGELRLPGTGYARTHQLFPDQYGKLGIANMHDILGDVAPWSQEYKAVDKMIQNSSLTTQAAAKVQQTRAQVEAMRYKNEFTPYEYKYQTAEQMSKHPLSYALGRTKEWIAHRDTFLNTKFLPNRTALEDWERDNVYGATFPTWESPIESFIKPSLYKSTQRNPFAAALAGGTLGSLFGANAPSRALGSVVGGIMGLGASLYGKGYEAATGDRFIPLERRKQGALEEYTDILDYTRSVVNASRAVQSGNNEAAQFFMDQSKKTMYGADLNSTPEQLAMAVPKRKREHFRAMLYAPEQEREQILSTAGRLERRLFQAAWNMPVEQRPELSQYFQEHELPPPNSAVWAPSTSMDAVKIKMGQSMGLDMSQMGFFPQQVKEANLINPSYPEFSRRSTNSSIRSQIQRLINSNGGVGSVSLMPTPFGDTRTQLNAGVY